MPIANYTYRLATLTDLPQLIALGLQAYGQYKDVVTPDGWNTMETNLKNENTYLNLLKIAQSYVCEYSGEIAGMAFLVPSGNPTAIFDAGWAYIRMVGVAPGHEGKGIARKLTQMCIDHAIKTNEQTIALHTSEMMDAARHLYESLGFVQQYEVGPFFGRRYWLYKRAVGT